MTLEQNQIQKLVSYLENFDKGNIINPSNINSKLGLKDKESQKLFSVLSSFGAFQHVYRYYCPNCNNLSYEIYNSLDEINKVEECEECYHDLPQEKYKYIAIYFKVIRDE